MALFDALTGGAYQRAARSNQQAIQAGTGLGGDALTAGANGAIGYLGVRDGGNALQSLGAGYGQARGDLTGQYGQTQGFLGAASDAAQGYLGGGGAQARSDLLGGYGGAADSLGAAYGAQQGYLGRATDSYDPMVAQGGRAFSAYGDAIGANGAEGSDRAQANFRAAPGYEYQRDQALEAVQRSAAARGGLAGGNATADILRTATGLADQSWNGYLANLNNGAGYYSQGLGAQAAGLGNQANAAGAFGTARSGLLQNQGTALSGLAQQVAQARANTASTFGQQQAAASQGQGAALGALGTGLGQGQANVFGAGAGIQSQFGRDVSGLQTGAAGALVNSNNQLAKAQTDASGNLLGGVLGLGKSLFGAAGDAGGFTNLFSNVFK